jgi:asparagine synthase (glutamine-hydrolysing)
MCGIVGIFSTRSDFDFSIIKEMKQKLRHRGPDGEGEKYFMNGAIGHQRLSIIDLSAGTQPMSNSAGSIWLTYNGEIYNYKVLRHRLQAEGYMFQTESDTEVIIHGYHFWGMEVLNKLRGMFAFALVDMKEEKVVLARDHFGIKPLYYSIENSSLIFGSELQAFQPLKNMPKTLDISALDDYLRFQFIPGPKTIWKEIQKLKPAHFLVWNFNGKADFPAQYWTINFTPDYSKSSEYWIEKANQVISDSVRQHLVADVSFGAFLSGGVDSTLVVSKMLEHLKIPVKTFSIGFEEEDYNELGFASHAANVLGTDHHAEIVKSDGLSVLCDLVQHFGEPYGDSSAIPSYYVCKSARKQVAMVLSGDGGDEIFAGYESYMHWQKFQARNYRKGIKNKIFPLAQRLFPNRYQRTDKMEDWLMNVEYFSETERRKLWKEDFMVSFEKVPSDYRVFNENFEQLELLQKAQFMDLNTYLPYDILTKMDVVSMMNSLEVRTPFIDTEIWDFASTIPPEINCSVNGGQYSGKNLLKKILLNNFSSDFVFRKKKGFSVPVKKWFAGNGILREMLMDKLISSSSSLNHYFNSVAVHELIEKNKAKELWLLLFLEEWLSANKN